MGTLIVFAVFVSVAQGSSSIACHNDVLIVCAVRARVSIQCVVTDKLTINQTGGWSWRKGHLRQDDQCSPTEVNITADK